MAETHATSSRPGGSLQCVVVTPETTVKDEAADFVALPLFDGEIGIALNHSPMIGRLGFGEMRIVREGHTDSFYVDGGFVEVVGNVITVLTNRALAAGEIDPAVVNEQLTSAQARPANTPELMTIRERLVAQARAQLLVARRSGQGNGRKAAAH